MNLSFKLQEEKNYVSVMKSENLVEDMKNNKLLGMHLDRLKCTTIARIPWHRADPWPHSCAQGTARACRPARRW